MKRPTVALVGRVNVGKSTLLNRLAEKEASIVSPVPGTTRDRTMAECLWRGRMFVLVDTGGVEADMRGEMNQNILDQIRQAITQSDLLLFVLDGGEGVTAIDRQIAKRIHSHGANALVVLNKSDQIKKRGGSRDTLRADVLTLGFGEPLFVSAKSGRESGDLLDAAFAHLPGRGMQPVKTEFSLTILGKPNVGKSTLMNALAGMERVVVSSEPHTTRDPQEHIVTFNGHPITIIDTAGIRRKGRIGRSSGDIVGDIEAVSVKKSERALRTSDIAVLLVDVSKQMTSQDTHLAGMILEAKKGLILVVNKWDLIEEKTPATYHAYEQLIRRRFPFLAWAPILFVSSLTKTRIHDILKTAVHVNENLHRQLSDEECAEFARSMKTPASMPIKSLVHVQTAPHVFQAEFGGREGVPVSVVRRVVNELRRRYDFAGAPIDLRVNQPKRKK
ncbi:MAG: ribosome biogenesis GTPase Der [Candidatus Kerfeldbacteria bacterium]|nr:ribosome biogenesis GTPase Der [Candidatus Kerfeldbacteria bacterium]